MRIKATARLDNGVVARAKVLNRTRAAKAKGRTLQKYVADKIKSTFGLAEEDVKSNPMGNTGADVWMSHAAQNKFPFKIECKNQEGFANLYNAWAQCNAHPGDKTPLLIIKSRHKKPLAVVDFEKFLELIETIYELEVVNE